MVFFHLSLRAFILWALFFSSACSLVDQKLDPNEVYRRDISLEINGQDFDGVAALPISDKYDIKLQAKGKIDLLRIKSCHRDETFYKPSSGFFGSRKKFEYTYKPVKGIENTRYCPLDIGVFEEKKGRHGWAQIDLEIEGGGLSATIKCDGHEYNTKGLSTSICQGASGSIQKIIFDERVKVSPDVNCNKISTTDEITYTINLSKGECVYFFGNKGGKFHKLTTIGYSSVLVRGD